MNFYTTCTSQALLRGNGGAEQFEHASAFRLRLEKPAHRTAKRSLRRLRGTRGIDRQYGLRQ
jgi:hypothetical protein